jgi:hypothetical protein
MVKNRQKLLAQHFFLKDCQFCRAKICQIRRSHNQGRFTQTVIFASWQIRGQ